MRSYVCRGRSINGEQKLCLNLLDWHPTSKACFSFRAEVKMRKSGIIEKAWGKWRFAICRRAGFFWAVKLIFLPHVRPYIFPSTFALRPLLLLQRRLFMVGPNTAVAAAVARGRSCPRLGHGGCFCCFSGGMMTCSYSTQKKGSYKKSFWCIGL